MRFTKRIGFMFAFAFFSACAGARAGDWVPARDHGAYIMNIQYGLEPLDEWNSQVKLKVTLQGTGEYTIATRYNNGGTIQDSFIENLYQSLLQAKADSLPVMLLAEADDRTFTRVLIGTVDPQFPVALRAPLAPGRDAGAAPAGFDLLGRARTQASARVPLLARPASR